MRDSLLKFADEVFPNWKINNLNDVAVAVGLAEFSEQMELLNRILYADASAELNGKIIIQALKQAKKNTSQNKDKQPLPNLYR